MSQLKAPLPVALRTLIITRSTSGATPMVPMPLSAAATMPETCVPWKPAGLSKAPSDVNDVLSARFRLGARSAWVDRMPLSMTHARAPAPLLPESSASG